MKKQTSSKQTNALILEAKLQTDALQRLGVWLRAAASLAVIGLLIAWWGFQMGAGLAAGILGVILTVVAGAAAFIIRQGRENGKKNVQRILKAAGIDYKNGVAIDV
ncbi:MAG TPA: hypothetical protein IAC96_09740 [Candidatus Fimimorpha faecalis]|uniref:DUF202 domain-containing protein n=1 Tax=Candidatus Fimimorpha faecalis TaxID=2840824 RepID=A0A9D1JDV6_9FIRM|nr:hypothetical protein NDGK_02236 [Clostridiales bacterium CHKCI001]HIR89220.1 hypothetical protein [Candidatus Fimimorpha faecalis]